ncbi:GIY-YIG nuclease family protein [Parabacteroides johnsonii]
MNINKELSNLFDDPILDVSDKELSLFNIPTDMKFALKRKPVEYVAQYKPCGDFDKYCLMFQRVHSELKTGKRSIIKINKTTSLHEGRYYVIDGIMLYLEKIEDPYTDKGNGLKNGRTRCILENGTETDILLQTLRKNVVGSGYGISEVQEGTDTHFVKQGDVNDKDNVTGYIYILSSLSSNSQIANIKNLYKIGFTTSSVEERIANAEKESTYLMAPVKIEAQYKIANMNSHVFETLLHQVLDAVQMRFIIYDDKGQECHPKEWFVVPISVIDTIILKILDGSITQYTYNSGMKCLEKVVQKAQSTLDVSGFKILTLTIKQIHFDEIVSGEKTVEYRELKQTTLNKYTYVDESDGKRYLRRYEMLRLYVGYGKNRESAIVEVIDIRYHEGMVEYHLGKILEHIKLENK